MQSSVLFLIEVYQKYISPYKGFRCAHAALYDGDSCSNAIKKIIKAHGVFEGYHLIRERLGDCKAAFLMLSEERDRKEKDQKKKRDWCGYCDACSVCDVISCIPRKCGNLPDLPDVPDLPCDCSLL